MARVLVVDDDEDVREALADRLGREFEVQVAAGAPEALALVAVTNGALDAIVTDLELPPYRGDDLLAAIAERHPHVCRIVHTGSSRDTLGFARRIAHRVFQKGCDLDELSAVIHDFVAHRRAG